jgi:hypothetical protein
MKQLEMELTRLAILTTAAYILVLAGLFVALYYTVKNAIRDGIRESGLIEATRLANADPKPNLSGIPEMRAER